MKYTKRNKCLTFLGALLTSLASAFLIYKDTLFNSRFIPANIMDGRLIVGITNHWYIWSKGMTEWKTLMQFYPFEGSLGLSDAFVLYGLPYSMLRYLGLNRYEAWEWFMLFFALFGFFGMYIFLRRLIGSKPSIAMLCSSFFVIGSPITAALHNSHMQLLAIWIVPWFLLVLLKAIESITKGSLISPFPFILALFYSLLALTSFYITWFLTLFLLLILAIYFVLRLFEKEDTPTKEGSISLKRKNLTDFLSRGLGCAKQIKFQIFIFIGFTVLCFTPFLLIYLPRYFDTSPPGFSQISHLFPSIGKLFYTGESNILIFILNKFIDRTAPEDFWELAYGIPPLTFVFLLFISYSIFRQRAQVPGQYKNWIIALILAILVSLALMVKVGSFPLWYILYNIVPGCSAIRAPERYFIMVFSGIIILSAFYFKYIFNANTFGKQCVAGISILFMIGEQLRIKSINYPIDQKEEIQRINDLVTPPSDMIAFYLENFSREWHAPSKLGTHAYTIAQEIGEPTINGFSGYWPDQYLVKQPWDQVKLRSQLKNWLIYNKIEKGVYALNLERNAWVPYEDPTEFSLLNYGEEIVNPNKDIYFQEYGWYGWSSLEHWGVWSFLEKAEIAFRLPGNLEQEPKLKLDVKGYINDKHPRMRVAVYVNNGLWRDFIFSLENNRRVLEIPLDNSKDIQRIRFEFDNAASPKELGLGGDVRKLGLGLHSMILIGETKNH